MKSTLNSNSNTLNNKKIKNKKVTQTQTQNNNTIKDDEKRKKKAEENSLKENDNRIDMLLTKEYLQSSELQFNKHLAAIDNQISNTNDIISMQENLFKRLAEINKEITVTDIKLEKFIVRSESEDYYNFIEKYAGSLDELLSVLKSQVQEIEMLRFIKKENGTLKSKVELLEIEKNDRILEIESKSETFKNHLISELNGFSDFVKEIDECVFLNKFSIRNIEESGISLYFQNLKSLYRNQSKKVEEMKGNYFFNIKVY